MYVGLCMCGYVYILEISIEEKVVVGRYVLCMYGRPYLVCFIKPPLIFGDARRSRIIVGPDLQDLTQLMFNFVSLILPICGTQIFL